MFRTVAELVAPVRAVLTLGLVALASLLAASVLAPQVSAESVLVIAALSTATTAMAPSRITARRGVDARAPALIARIDAHR